MLNGISFFWILPIRIILILVYISTAFQKIEAVEVQRYDGWYNNRAHPEWGAVDTRLIRKTPYAYSDGVYMLAGQNRPSPRKISELVLRGVDGLASLNNLTVMMALFGQVVSFEILLSSVPGCPIERIKIPIDVSDSVYTGPLEMPIRRIKYDPETGQSPNSPREQINLVTSWIDGSFIYNTKELWLFAMRTFENGTLKINNSNNLPPFASEDDLLIHHRHPHDGVTFNPEKSFLIGDSRANQHAASLAFSILFYRYHNYWAKKIKQKHSNWNDEAIFQEARRKVISVLQNIIMYEYLPTLLGEEISKYTGYKGDIHSGISSVFQSSAFRFGHSTVPPGLYKRNGTCHFEKSQNEFVAMRMCSNWWTAEEEIVANGIEPFLMGMASQIAEREDAILVSDLRDKLYGPLEFNRRDLGALNIMRGRDMGITDYNTARIAFKLPRIKKWSEINPTLHKEEPEFFQELSVIYNGNLNNLDLYVGGMIETENGVPGPLFKAIIKDQFERIRDGDRFWFENTENGFFTEEEIGEIKKITLYDVILKATNIKDNEIQKDVFVWVDGNPCPQPAQLNSSVLAQCEDFEKYDYFDGNELPYIYMCVLLMSIPIICILCAYLTIHFQNKHRRKAKIQNGHLFSNNNNLKSHHNKIYAKEWLHENHKRAVKIKFGPEEAFYVVNRKGERLREINVKTLTAVMAEETEDDKIHDPMVWIHGLKDHDLVLQFDSDHLRKKFITKLEKFLAENSKELLVLPTHYDILYQKAETKERRQRRLEHFFREAYAQAFEIGGKGCKPPLKDKDAHAIMRTCLTKSEFAEALGMRQDSLFVEQMFACVDKDQDGRLSFQEFLDTVVLFSKGSIEEKLFIIFEMCDKDRSGFVDKNEFCTILRSLVDMASTHLKADEVDELICGLLDDVGLSHNSVLTKEDFLLLLKDYKKDLVAIGLDCKGVKQNFLSTKAISSRMTSFNVELALEEERSWYIQKWDALTTFLEDKRQQIFYLVIFYTITIGLGIERFIYYTYLSKHIDLKTVMGYGIGITRGCAASLSFSFSLMLLTMCRNIITTLRDTVVNQYFPLDWIVEFHKIIAFTGLFFAVIHTVGHLLNFYHVSTQPIEHLQCLFKELNFDLNDKPTFIYWMLQTITGLTGILLVIILSIIFVFSCPQIRKSSFSAFWLTHKLYIPFFVLCILHGLPRLLDAPRFWYFFTGPCILYIFDYVIGLRQKHRYLEILDVEILPSDVTYIRFSRPPNFHYRSGQWVRVACTAFKPDDYHSFTLTSAPHEGSLCIYVKAQGPWTWKLRNTFDPNNLGDNLYPKLRIEGPYGGGNQEWYRFEIAVMIGGGIGVTPYASILNDLVFGTSTNRYSGVLCKKVYFVWICPTHRHFEWFIDVLKDVESKDVTNVLEMHIFITQFFHKFDLRTTMLYICENHFQRISKRSMFTGLKAINHFGRPDIPSFLKYVQQNHQQVKKVGVFSCGPSSLTRSVGKACDIVNKRRQLPYVSHHYENF